MLIPVYSSNIVMIDAMSFSPNPLDTASLKTWYGMLEINIGVPSSIAVCIMERESLATVLTELLDSKSLAIILGANNLQRALSLTLLLIIPWSTFISIPGFLAIMRASAAATRCAPYITYRSPVQLLRGNSRGNPSAGILIGNSTLSTDFFSLLVSSYWSYSIICRYIWTKYQYSLSPDFLSSSSFC